MNKIFLWIVLAVIILGLLLILLNTRMGQSGDAPVPADNSVSAPVKPAPPVPPPAGRLATAHWPRRPCCL